MKTISQLSLHTDNLLKFKISFPECFAFYVILFRQMADSEKEGIDLAEGDMEVTSTEKQTEEITDVADSNKEQTDRVLLNETGLPLKEEYNIDSTTQELGIAEEPMQEQDAAVEQVQGPDAFENLNISQEPVQDAGIAEEQSQRIDSAKDQTTAKEPGREEEVVADMAVAEELALELDTAQTEFDAKLPDFQKDGSHFQDFDHEIKPTGIETDATASESTGASEGVSEQHPDLTAVVAEGTNMENLAAQLTEMIKSAIVTGKYYVRYSSQSSPTHLTGNSGNYGLNKLENTNFRGSVYK